MRKRLVVLLTRLCDHSATIHKAGMGHGEARVGGTVLAYRVFAQCHAIALAARFAGKIRMYAIAREERRCCVQHASDALQGEVAVCVTGQLDIGKASGAACVCVCLVKASFDA